MRFDRPTRQKSLRPKTAAALISACLLWGWALAAPVSAAPTTTYSGQATAVRATVYPLGTTTTLADTGPLPSSGGAGEASLLSASVPGVLSANVLHATTVAQNGSSRSEASAADVNVTAGGDTVSAAFLMARTSATCTPGGAVTSGSSELATLVVNGQAITVSGAPNQTVALPVGTLVINEQSTSPGSITVNALHLTVTGVADVIVASAHSDIHCAAKSDCSHNDFVTGGGWITGTPSGDRGNFGVAGGLKNGALWGHLAYIDHGANGPSVKGTGVTAYSVVSATVRHISGTAEINGQAGFTYSVEVADNGEPGTADSFTLSLSNGYTASGLLRGGNIQLHKPC